MSKNDVCPVISVKAFFVCTHTKKAFTDISGQTGHLGHLVVVALKNRMFLQNFFSDLILGICYVFPFIHIIPLFHSQTISLWTVESSTSKTDVLSVYIRF
jgi:hypothetical protein